MDRSRRARLAGPAFCFLTLFAHAALTQSLSSEVERIELSPAWAGSEKAARSVVTITNDQGVFKRSWNPTTISADYNQLQIIGSDPDHPPDLHAREQEPGFSQDIVNTREVMALVRALSAPTMSSPSLSNLGITPAWLADHAGDAAKHFGTLGEPNDRGQQEFFRKSFTDLALSQRIIPNVVRASWTDDAVWVHIVLRFKNGTTISAESENQPAFMLPWTCQANGKTTRTYNADISRAIANLLPIGAVNRERLQGEGLEDQVVFEMPGALRGEWQRIGAEDIAGDALARLRHNYTIRRSEVSEHIGLQFGPDPPKPGVEILQADVRRSSFPTNLVVATVFPFEGGDAIGIDTFLQEGQRYERIVLDNPWIMVSLKKHPDLGAWLIFVKDVSMSEKAMRIFAADMHAHGRDDLAQEVSAHRAEIADLSYYGDEVILFPDHHAILWRWDPNRELFGWSASEVKTQQCTDYPTLDVGCAAAVVSTDGKLER